MNFNWKKALSNRYLEFFTTVVWLIAAITQTVGAEGWLEWFCALCAYGCAACWARIFYRRAKRDGA